MEKKLLTWGNVSRHFSRIVLIVIAVLCSMTLFAFPLLQKRVTLSLKNVTIEYALSRIVEGTGYGLVFVSSDIKDIKNVNVESNNQEPIEILTNLTKAYNLTYRQENNTIIISRAPQTPQVQDNKKVVIKGKVISSDNKEPVVGALVIAMGTANGAITDDNGAFSLTSVPDIDIEVSFLGYKAQVVRVIKEQTDLIIRLERDLLAVDDVIVTGIFNKSRESYTGAVTTITSKEIKMYKGQNLLTTIRNIDPSINIVTNNDLGSNPNAIPEINIRGNSSLSTSIKELNEEGKQRSKLNEPLVIMDGFEISLQKLIDFNDEEIESINIMKDASATAIYGSRGANGVIVIITKAPQAGKLKISVQGGANIQIPDLSSYNLLNASQKLKLEDQLKIYNSDETYKNAIYQEEYNNLLRGVIGGVDTYWLSKPLQVGVGQRYNMRLEGGSSDFRWGVSLGYNQVDGVMKGSFRNTFNGTVDLTYTLNNVIFKNQTQIGMNKGQESPYGNFSEYAKMNPYWRTHDDNGNLIKSYRSVVPGLGTIGNPLYNAQLNTTDYSKATDIINNFSIEWEILNGLTLRGKLGLIKTFNTADNFLPSAHTEFDKEGYSYFQKGSYQYTTGERDGYDASATLSYAKQFADKHQLYVGMDYSLAEKNGYSYMFEAEGYSKNDGYLPDANLYKAGEKPSGSESKTRRVSFTGNVNYTFDNRYFVDFSYRIDGASQFGTQNKFAPFWSSGIGWNLHHEKWMQKYKTVNELRLRASYGETGSQQFEAYRALATYRDYNKDRYMHWNGAYLMGFGNERLTWQKTNQLNVGTEVGLFGSRLRLNLDYYQKETSNLLSEMELPLANGFPSYTDNVGSVRNNGFEAMLMGYLIRNTSKNILWTVTGRIAYNKNKIVKLSDAIKLQNEERIASNREINRLMIEGRSENSLYVVESLGIDPSSGQEIFLNKDGKPTYDWNVNALRYLGVSEPKYRGNIGTMFSYKNVTVNLSFGYHWGGKQYNSTLLNKVEIPSSAARMNVDERVLDSRWQKPGDMVFFKSFHNIDGSAAGRTKMSSRFVFDDNMFSLQSASVQYSWRSKWIQENLHMQTINFSCNMNDLFYVSTIKRERGTAYPFSRTISATVSLVF